MGYFTIEDLADQGVRTPFGWEGYKDSLWSESTYCRFLFWYPGWSNDTGERLAECRECEGMLEAGQLLAVGRRSVCADAPVDSIDEDAVHYWCYRWGAGHGESQLESEDPSTFEGFDRLTRPQKVRAFLDCGRARADVTDKMVGVAKELGGVVAVFSGRFPPGVKDHVTAALEAYDGEVQRAVDDDTTHLIVADGKKPRKKDKEPKALQEARARGLPFVGPDFFEAKLGKKRFAEAAPCDSEDEEYDSGDDEGDEDEDEDEDEEEEEEEDEDDEDEDEGDDDDDDEDDDDNDDDDDDDGEEEEKDEEEESQGDSASLPLNSSGRRKRATAGGPAGRSSKRRRK